MTANEIESAAARWLIRLEANPSQETRAGFDTWVAADPRNHAAFMRLEKTWGRADILTRLRPLDGVVDEQVLDRFGAPTPVPDEPVVDPPAVDPPVVDPPRARMPWTSIAAPLLILALGAITWIMFARPGWHVYETGFGGFQRVVLPDGSTATLNTDSRIRARMNSGRREIVLDRGEALFTVAHDAHRPFDVTAANTVVRAVGTAFSVRLRGQEQVDVIVTKGRVAIDPEDSPDAQPPESNIPHTVSTVAAGEALSVKARRLRIEKIAADEMTRQLAWTQGKIWLDRATLTEAVAQFNRYNRRQLVYDGPADRNLHFIGAYDATDLDGFVAVLEKLGIRAVPGPDEGSGPPVTHLVGAAKRNELCREYCQDR